ncbi:DNA repair protein RecN [Secundilactobacillus malefermentans]|uniref:DNA repair protein RecN n=1 Tax=Secundilactobacillus malefermentans TaxID=176292 RepID=A0A4R5NT36_9LACO|nr:DNA repair protein RecN [Secundilactobacillus malefermentans]KRM59632.1 DNA repair ATPase [Secundilactobacillus malefermentans DSM 5705 = KCTC 3548]QEA32457.1 DNA repair protein RecN [Secundilactobacillus malefermentans]TDG80413.1 hypothetical protein C5L31_000779 [Secundilactobacillus malefermentans]
MIQALSIRNFAIIEKLDVEFDKGMTVLTGETGAGKSIIIDAVGLLAGGRGSQHFIRTGADKAVLQGSFVLPKGNVSFTLLDELGIDHDDHEIILQREIHRNGRNVCRVNSMLVNIQTLKRIGETLVDIHGQNEHQELMQPEKHIFMLDEYANGQIATKLEAYKQSYEAYSKLKKAVDKRRANEKEWAQRLDMLKFQVNEIEDAQLQHGEEEKLNSERDRLNNFQKINESLNRSFSALAGDDEISGALDSVGEAMNALASIEDLDSEFKELSGNVNSAFYALQDASQGISRQIDLLEWDDNRLNEIEKRLATIQELKHKYGDSEDQVISYFEKISKELAEMEENELSDSDVENDLMKKQQDLWTRGIELSKIRKSCSKDLVKAIHKQLADLYMEKTVFEVRFSEPKKNTFYRNGIDQLEFYIQPNPGEEMRPLAKIASGGELSRIMLALKMIFSRTQGVTSIIFDEVDTGVSGRVAQAIAEKISDISRESQVLCITHLPQVAAMSDHHYFIAKHVSGGRTETTLAKLTAQHRIDEIARMLAGAEITKLAKQHAKELLDLGEKAKSK